MSDYTITTVYPPAQMHPVVVVTTSECCDNYIEIVEHEALEGVYAPGSLFAVRQPCGHALPGHYGVYHMVWTGKKMRRAAEFEQYLFRAIR